MLNEDIMIKNIIKRDKNAIIYFIHKNFTGISKLENREKLIRSLFGKATDEELFEIYELFNCYKDEMIAKIIFDELLKSDLNTEMIVKVIPYIDCSFIKDYNVSANNVKSILRQLIIYRNYEQLFSIISINNLGEEYFEYVINYVLLLERTTNNIFNTKNADNLFKLLYCICYADSLRQFDFDTDGYKAKIEEEIIKAGDEKNIVKTGIYIDKYLLSNIFTTKSSLIEYLLLNDYDEEEIKLVIEKFYTEDEKSKINHKISENIDGLGGNIPVNKKDRFENNNFLLKYTDN